MSVFGNDKLDNLGNYEDCILSKAYRLQFKAVAYTTKEKLSYVHSDS